MRLTQRRLDQESPDPERDPARRRSPWRFGVPAVCLAAGLLLAATHGVSRVGDIRGSDSPGWSTWCTTRRPRSTALDGEREALAARIDSNHGARAGTALAAMQRRIAAMAPRPAPNRSTDRPDRDAHRRLPRRAGSLSPTPPPDDLVVHQQDIDAVLNALWSAGAEAVAMQGPAHHRHLGTPLCWQTRCCSTAGPHSPPYTITALGDAAAMQAALATAPLVRLYKQYVIRFGLGYSEQPGPDIEVPGYTGPLSVRYAQPAGPLGY